MQMLGKKLRSSKTKNKDIEQNFSSFMRIEDHHIMEHGEKKAQTLIHEILLQPTG